MLGETINLGRDEVTVTETSLCGVSETKTLYAELGSVDRNTCLCWVSAASGFGRSLFGLFCLSCWPQVHRLYTKEQSHE
jgi:hypothetical protein